MGNSLSLCKLDMSSRIRAAKGKNREVFNEDRTGTHPAPDGAPGNVVALPPVAAEAEPTMAVKRIKVVITKKQLQELLTKKISVEAVVLGMDGSESDNSSVDSPTSWKPILKSIPEEDEL